MTDDMIPVPTSRMQRYFKQCSDDIGGTKRARDLEIASIPAMCLELGISKVEFDNMESGTDEQVAFYNEVLTRYEALCDRYQSFKMMTDSYRQNLDKTLFARAGGESKTAVVVSFPAWNAPDDYEKYREWKQAEGENGQA